MRKSVPKCGDAWGCNFSVWRLEFVGIKSRVTVSPWVSSCSNLHAVGPGSEVLAFRQNLMVCNFFRVGPLGWALGRGLLCGSPSLSTEKFSSIFVL
ncbi:hypothetical protein V1477_005150 [Vespula maculifrons]|uniref:Uncharacterized protein n=1 Tax=Vespula maculifrons TaxID=7453 RepID=A0ABD2CNU4_VESMC